MESFADLNEYIVINVPSPSKEIENKTMCWTQNDTKILIDLYTKYKDKVGTMKIRNQKAMWEIISKEISEILKTPVTRSNCENRWKVLERNFKKYILNKTSTGRGRKTFEYAEEMELVMGSKKSINPELLLGSETVHVPEDINEVGLEENENNNSSEQRDKNANIKENSEERGEIVRKNYIKRTKTVMEMIRRDRKEYQEKRLKQGEEKLELLRNKNKLLEKKIRILEEKNQCSCLKGNEN